MNNGYNFDTVRKAEQRKQMEDLAARGICAFCPEHFSREHREPVELRTKHWTVSKNDYPYEGTYHHLLLVPDEHVATFSDLSNGARSEFPDVVVAVEKQWGLTHYAVGMRSGDMRYTGGSVEHLHAHIVVGQVDDPKHTPVRFKMSSRPKS